MESAVYTSKAPIDVSCMALAVLWSQLRSKDPRTKVGACVYHPKSGGLFLGYNGFPSGIPDLKSIWDQRDPAISPCKRSYVVHAEMNAVRKALTVFRDLTECVLYVSHFPCRDCMKNAIISSGLRSVVYMSEYPGDPVSRELAAIAKIEVRKSRAQFTFVAGSDKLDVETPLSIAVSNLA